MVVNNINGIKRNLTSPLRNSTPIKLVGQNNSQLIMEGDESSSSNEDQDGDQDNNSNLSPNEYMDIYDEDNNED